MRFNGHNILAIIVAAIVIYALEFVIFAVLISPEQYMAFTGVTDDADARRHGAHAVRRHSADPGGDRAFAWRSSGAMRPGWMGGAMTGLMMAVLFAFGTSLYGYVYGPHTRAYLPVNLGHFLVCWGVAGAILGAWK